jgi:hypothetical protein
LSSVLPTEQVGRNIDVTTLHQATDSIVGEKRVLKFG